jgi:hypothetical protein
MSIFKSLLIELQEKIGSSHGRADLFVATLLAIIIPFSASRASNVLRFLKHIFDLTVTRRQFYTFIASTKLPWERLWTCLWKLIPYPITNGRILLALDDSINPKVGKKIFACHSLFDHAKKQNQSSYVWGQNIVMLGMLMLVHNRWAFLPMAFQFYRLKKDIVSGFKTKIEQAVSMTLKIAAVFTEPVLLLITDSWFGNNSLYAPLHKILRDRIHLLSRYRCNASLYDLPILPKKKKRGRPKKYGKKLGSVEELAEKLKKKAIKHNVFLYGKQRDAFAVDKVVISKNLKRIVRIVWVYYRDKWVALFTTDLSLSISEIISYYSARWKIEAGFKELKQDLGSALCQARIETSVTNHLNLCMMSMALAWIYAKELPKVPTRLHAVKGRQHYAFSDIRRVIAKDFGDGIFDDILSKGVNAQKKGVIKTLLELAA